MFLAEGIASLATIQTVGYIQILLVLNVPTDTMLEVTVFVLRYRPNVPLTTTEQENALLVTQVTPFQMVSA